jgi:HK97 family phage prohead protease
MKLKRLQFGFEIKALEKDGSFAGYGSVFNNTDKYRDVVKPGAFSKTLEDWKAKGALPPILWQHNSAAPIGPYTKMVEDEKGLYTEGQLLINDVQQAREAHALMKTKTIRGQSIGYNVPKGGEEYDGDTNVNNLKEIDLWECSIVTFPANTSATVTEVKQILDGGEVPTIREFERYLRDVGGYSRKQAESIARIGYVEFLKTRDAVGESEGGGAVSDAEIEKLAKYIESFKIS